MLFRSQVGRVKSLVCSSKYQKLKEFAEKVLDQDTISGVERILKNAETLEG